MQIPPWKLHYLNEKSSLKITSVNITGLIMFLMFHLPRLSLQFVRLTVLLLLLCLPSLYLFLAYLQLHQNSHPSSERLWRSLLECTVKRLPPERSLHISTASVNPAFSSMTAKQRFESKEVYPSGQGLPWERDQHWNGQWENREEKFPTVDNMKQTGHKQNKGNIQKHGEVGKD